MDRISAHNNFSFKHRFQRSGLPALVSDLLNPLVTPTLVIAIVAWLFELPRSPFLLTLGISLLCYTLIPLGTSLYLLRTNRISSLDLPERKSRYTLFGVSLFSGGVACFIFYNMAGYLDPVIPTIGLIFLINPGIAFLINFFWKISIHSAAIASGGAIFIYLSQTSLLPSGVAPGILSLIFLLLLLPLIIWARYCLKVHHLNELLGGALAGFLFTIIELTLLVNLW